jgi:hypothetical protein
MNKTRVLADLKTELAKTEKRLEKFNQMVAERNHLLDLIKAWEMAFPDRNGNRSEAKPSGLTQPVTRTPVLEGSTEHFAYRSLIEFGPLGTGPLLVSIRQKGWRGSGDDKKDSDRLYQAMKRRKGMFGRTKDGRWFAVTADTVKSNPLADSGLRKVREANI